MTNQTSTEVLDEESRVAAFGFLKQNYGRISKGGFDGRGKPIASPMLTVIMSGGDGISGRELYKYR